MTILPAQFYCYRPAHSVKISHSVSQIRGLAFLYETPFLKHLQAASEIRRWRCVRSPSKALFESGTQTLLRLCPETAERLRRHAGGTDMKLKARSSIPTGNFWMVTGEVINSKNGPYYRSFKYE